MELIQYPKAAAVEQLVFEVEKGWMERFIQADHEIWTQVLAEYDDRLEKELWIDESGEKRIATMIYWSDIQRWKTIPQEVLQQTGARFDAVMGGHYRLISQDHQLCQMMRTHYCKHEETEKKRGE